MVCGRLKSAFQIASRSGSVADVQYVAHQVGVSMTIIYAIKIYIIVMFIYKALPIYNLKN